jgi:hypothetical protein
VNSAGRWRTVGAVLAFGAAYDVVFGLGILALTRPLASLLGLTVPADPVYVHLNGVLLLVLGGIYAAAAHEPERYRLIAPISALGRGLGFLFFLWAWTEGRPPAFLALGVADLVLAAATLYTWRRAAALSD